MTLEAMKNKGIIFDYFPKHDGFIGGMVAFRPCLALCNKGTATAPEINTSLRRWLKAELKITNMAYKINFLTNL